MYSDIFNKFKVKAIAQMKELNEFYEANETHLRYNRPNFVSDNGTYFKHIILDGSDVLAEFTLRSWEYSNTFHLDLETGFDKQMEKMKEEIERSKLRRKEELKKHQAAKKAKYEALKAEFE